MLKKILNFDTTIFFLINSHHNAFWDSFMWYVSYPYTWIPLYLFIIFLLYKKQKKGFWLSLVLLLVAVSTSDFTSVHLFKEVFRRLRPCHNPDILHLVHLVKGHCGGKYGFVSSHSANVFTIALFTSYLIKDKIYVIMIFLWAVLIAYSRVYLGVHYPLDVICGALLGVFISSVFILIKKFLKKK